MTGSNDNKVIDWIYKDSNFTQTEIGTHNSIIRDVAWAPNVGLQYDIVASACEDGSDSVKIWKLAGKWECLQIIKLDCAAWRVSWSPTSNILTVSTS